LIIGSPFRGDIVFLFLWKTSRSGSLVGDMVGSGQGKTAFGLVVPLSRSGFICPLPPVTLMDLVLLLNDSSRTPIRVCDMWDGFVVSHAPGRPPPEGPELADLPNEIWIAIAAYVGSRPRMRPFDTFQQALASFRLVSTRASACAVTAIWDHHFRARGIRDCFHGPASGFGLLGQILLPPYLVHSEPTEGRIGFLCLAAAYPLVTYPSPFREMMKAMEDKRWDDFDALQRANEDTVRDQFLRNTPTCCPADADAFPNPLTGRNVQRNGRIGRSLIRRGYVVVVVGAGGGGSSSSS
jgi:hypothetical protein